MSPRFDRNLRLTRERRRRKLYHLPGGLAAILVATPHVFPFSSQQIHGAHAFTPLHRHVEVTRTILLPAKRRNRSSRNDDSMNWYDEVDDNATPDSVFWEEMERQRLYNQIGGEQASSGNSPNGSSTMTPIDSNSASAFMSPSNPVATTFMEVEGPASKPPTLEQIKAADATLSEYTMFQVADNYLDENLQEMYLAMQQPKETEPELSIEEETKRLEEQLEALPDGPRSLYDEDDSPEPWDNWGEETQESSLERAGTLEVPEPASDSEFFMNWEPNNVDDIDASAQDEKEFRERMKDCQIQSRRLSKAQSSPKAASYFAREPNKREGYDRLWVAAIEPACFSSLTGNIRNYGVEFADNFGDFVDGRPEDGLYTIEDVALYKARKVYEVTGLPCVASRTSFEIEPIPTESMTGPSTAKSTAPPGTSNNPKVYSGYRINDVGNHVDYMAEALKPLSEPTRVTRFTSCICFYDGEMEIFEYCVCDVDLIYCNSRRTFIPMSQAIHNMIETLKMTFGLEYQKWLRAKGDAVAFAGSGGVIGSASIKLRDRVLKDGKVLPNEIIDVSAFMDSKVDVDLMDTCARELADRFVDTKPSKILTIATTGLVIALPMAKYLQVPVVYARKERNMVMADTFQAGYASKTVGKDRELIVSKKHLDPNDRVLVVDDFLSSGSSQEALLRIISEADATAVGVGVLLEKVYESGRQSLSGFNIPIQSLCRVASVKEGAIQLLEEEGFEQ